MEAMAYNGATCDPTRVDPKVLQWVKSNCAKKPHFIKVINQTAAVGWLPPPGARDAGRQQCKMIVPRPFAREHFRKLGRVITLENGVTQKKWKVSFGTANKSPSWLQGWKRVVIGNQLAAGDVMVFVLTGDSHFVFHLFDELGLPKVHSEASAVKIEPKRNLHTHVDDAVTGFERSCDKCKSKLFDPDIVKLEPGARRADAAMVSPEEAAGAKWNESPLPAITDMGEKTITRGPRSTPDHQTRREGSEAVEKERPEHGGMMASSMHHRQVPPSLDPLVPQRIGSPLPNSKLPVADMVEETGQQSTPVRTSERLEGGSAIRIEGRPGHGGTMVSSALHRQLPPLDPLAFLIKSRRRIPTTMEKKRARDLAKAHAERLVGYRFLVVLSESQVYRDFHLPLPEQFVSDSGTQTQVSDAADVGGPEREGVGDVQPDE